MELKKRFDVRKFLIISYVLVFAVYIIYGLQPARAAEAIKGHLTIGTIGLSTDVAAAETNEEGLITPDDIPAIYSINPNKALVYGHSARIFEKLDLLKVGDVINYNNKDYYVTSVTVQKKDDVRMNGLLSGRERDTIILMTCAGELYENGDASHRLLVTAVEK